MKEPAAPQNEAKGSVDFDGAAARLFSLPTLLAAPVPTELAAPVPTELAVLRGPTGLGTSALRFGPVAVPDPHRIF